MTQRISVKIPRKPKTAEEKERLFRKIEKNREIRLARKAHKKYLKDLRESARGVW